MGKVNKRNGRSERARNEQPRAQPVSAAGATCRNERGRVSLGLDRPSAWETSMVNLRQTALQRWMRRRRGPAWKARRVGSNDGVKGRPAQWRAQRPCDRSFNRWIDNCADPKSSGWRQNEKDTEQQTSQGRIRQLCARWRSEPLKVDVLVAVVVNHGRHIGLLMVAVGQGWFVRMPSLTVRLVLAGSHVLVRESTDMPMPMCARDPHDEQCHADKSRDHRSGFSERVQHHGNDITGLPLGWGMLCRADKEADGNLR